MATGNPRGLHRGNESFDGVLRECLPGEHGATSKDGRQASPSHLARACEAVHVGPEQGADTHGWIPLVENVRRVGPAEHGPWYAGAMELDDVLAVIRAFNVHGVKYVLIGGVALSLHGLVRGTEDVDVLVAPGAENFSRIRLALRSLFGDSSIEEITAEDASRYAVIRYGPPDGRFYIDLLTRIGEAFRYGEIESETIEVDGVAVRVATPRALYRMKRNTLRGRDRDDAMALKIRFDLMDEETG